MAFTTCSVATNNVASLDDLPNDVGGLTPAQLKAVFDQFGTEFVAWFNATHLAELPIYAEGDWTPTLYGSTTAGSNTYATQTGKYVKIGKQVTAYGWIVLSAKDVAMAGDIKIGGLPFTVGATLGSISIGYLINLDFNADENILVGYPVNLTNRCDLMFVRDNLAATKPQPAQIQNNTAIIFTVHYYAAS